MAETIRITPQELRDASTYLGLRLQAISGEAKSLQTKLEEIGANWEGAARSTFFDIFENDMWPVLSVNLPELIEGIMAQLNGTAEGLDKADFEISQKLRG